MLIEFTVENFLSFKERFTLSMVASGIQERTTENCFIEKKFNLLKSAAIYGANASGKTNFIQAANFFRGFVRNSSKDSQSGEKIKVLPFLLDSNCRTQPSMFEIVMVIDDIRYRYGCELTPDRVEREWLFHSKDRETRMFLREGENYQLSSSFKKLKKFTKITRENALFLSVCAQFNDEISTKIIDWFTKSFNFISGSSDTDYMNFSINQIENNTKIAMDMKKFLKSMDTGIFDIAVKNEKIHEDQLPDELKNELTENRTEDGTYEFKSFVSIHNVLENSVIVDQQQFGFGFESEGTQKMFNLSGPVFDTLARGTVLFVDELDTRLHPLITQEFVKMFNSSRTNPNNAQLIFITHDPKLLTNKFLRRDQIWLIEKDQSGASTGYSLVEFQPRKGINLEKAYLDGRYGAIPYIDDIASKFSGLGC